jgi:putative membrane protein
MKKIIFELLVTALTLILADYLIPGVKLGGSIEGFLLVTLFFFGINKFVKPILKVLSLPIEVATLGIFTVVIDTILLLVVDYLLIPLHITSFWFPGITLGPILVAPMRVPVLITAIMTALFISFTSTVIIWLTD